jgi:hypothetical protein
MTLLKLSCVIVYDSQVSKVISFLLFTPNFKLSCVIVYDSQVSMMISFLLFTQNNIQTFDFVPNSSYNKKQCITLTFALLIYN